jgi:hypothetical protein
MSTSTALAAVFDLLQGEVEAKVARVNQEGSAAYQVALARLLRDLEAG